MDEHFRESADAVRTRLERGVHDALQLRTALLRVPPPDRDAWVNHALGLAEIPEDGPELPRGCVPYLPCSVDALLRTVEHANVTSSDVFIDIGAGAGRAAALVHLLTGAAAVGIEIQPALVAVARELATRLKLPRVSFVEGDAVQCLDVLREGSVFFLYCPFATDRLVRLLPSLESVARLRPISICCVELVLPALHWLELATPRFADLAIYRSKLLT